MTDLDLLYFAGRCLSLDDNLDFRNEAIRVINSGTFELERFVFVCSGHLVLQTIYVKFKAHDILDRIPIELSKHLRYVYELNAKRNQGLLLQTKQIADILEMGGVKPIFLKGSANLLDGVYGDIGERLMGDIDFLVADNDFLKSAELLMNAGYEKAYEVSQWSDVKKAKHYPGMSHPDHPAYIELHRLPTDHKYLHIFNFKMIQEEVNDASSYSWGFVPSNRHKIMHNFVHGQLANNGNVLGVVSLRDVYDLYLLSKRFSPAEVLTCFKKQEKVKAYFTICGEILGLKGFYSRENYAYKVFNFKQKLSLTTKYFYKVFHTLYFLYQRVIVGYIFLVIRAIYSKEKRRYLFSRLFNRKWYGNHVTLYTRFFNKDE